MKKIVVTLIFIIGFLNINLFAQTGEFENEAFYRVEIHLNSASIHDLIEMGVSIDHVHNNHKSNTIIAELAGAELALMKENSVYFEVLVEDVSQWYVSRMQKDLQSFDLNKAMKNAPENFQLGSMGGHKTFEEVVEALDQMYELFPDLITEKFSIGESIEGREIWAVWIGTELEEEEKPQALYTSLTHAREPNSMMAVIYYMWWLLENYETDNTATFIVDNRHLAFIPVLNPDGYEFNRVNNPNGGGMHRKNRRPVGSWRQGVDLNRNFGPFQFWDHPNGGSDATNPNSDVYRGAEPFSEPETDALRSFVYANDFRTAFNYHTFSNLLIYPYGALQRVTVDHHILEGYAIEMTQYNNYVYGTDDETVGYSTRGNSDDWMYGLEAGNPRDRMNIIAFTPEVGSWSDYFWPPPSRIIPLSEENLHPNILLALYAGPDLMYSSDMVPEPDVLILEAGAENHVSFTFGELYNYGRYEIKPQLTLISDNDDFFISFDTVDIPAIEADTTFSGITDSFIIEPDASMQDGEEVTVILKMSAPWLDISPEWEYTFTVQGSATAHRDDEIAQKFNLKQNYPNPFNPTTLIRFTLPEHNHVTLDVFDITGRKVQNLVNDALPSGQHSVSFDAAHLASGVYIYRLQAGSYTLTRKMTLTK